MLGCDFIMGAMGAVKKSTRKDETMVRERVLPWYKLGGNERGEK